MIIKSVLGRYERWNPVHPTYGTFWGMGVGIGCGIGWGPGFGPEVIGYVGAGCGVGFHIGVTLLGLGIGFPANFLFAFPHRDVTKRSGLDISQTGSLLGDRSGAGDGWDDINANIRSERRSSRSPFSRFKIGNSTENKINMAYVKSMLTPHAEHITGCLQRVSGGFFPGDGGSKS